MTLTTTQKSFEEAAARNPIVSVCREIFADSDTPASIYRKVATPNAGSFLLESAEQGGVWTRFSFVGAGSFGTLTEEGGKAQWKPSPHSPLTETRLLSGGVSHLEPLEALERVYAKWESEQVAGLPPLTSGFVGYVGWETIRQLVPLPAAPVSETEVPMQALSLVSELIVIDHKEGLVILITNVLCDQDELDTQAAWDSAQARLDTLQERLGAASPTPLATLDTQAQATPTRITPRETYLNDVSKAISRIHDGEVSQVVVSQRFDHPSEAEPLDVYRVLRHLNPSPFLYLLELQTNAGDPFAVVGSSPEALITVQDGRVLTHPIAGSRARGKDHAEDQRFEEELLADEKERSEHIMLVDLSKRDLAEFCEPESVTVSDFMRIERFSHVMHIVSTVEGTLAEGQTPISALRATFPAGTLSGDPKPRALAMITELEPAPRGVYGGVVGYFGLAGDADLAIAIRTATICNGVASVQAGGGIVAGSIPENEDQECRNKAAAPLRAVAIANTLQPVRSGHSE